MGRTGVTKRRGLLGCVVATCLIVAFTVPTFSAASAGVRSPSGTSAHHGVTRALAFQSPVWTLKELGPVWMSAPVVATIDNVKAVILATLSGEIYVVNAKSGRELPGWPQWVHINSPTPTAVDSSPAVAYLDGPDRPPSIIVGAGSLWRPDQQGGLEAFYASGKVRFVFQTRRTFNPWSRSAPNDYSDPVFATPAVGDITGTGQPDIVFGSYDHNIYALQPDGHLVPGFPVQRADSIWSSPTLVDTSQTGRDDIIMGGDASGFDHCRGGWIVDYRYVGAGPKLMWQRCTAQTIWSSPTVGILNNTGRPAVVVGTSFYSGYKSATTNEIIAVYADNGENVPGWPVTARGPTFGSPAIGRIDGQLAVVSTSCARCINGPATVSAWSGSGHQIWSEIFDPHNEATSSPVLADLTGGADDGDDVLVGAGRGLYVLAGDTGKVLPIAGSRQPALEPGCDTANSAAVAYVPGAPGNGWMLYFACGGPTIPARLVAYPFPTAPAASDPPTWPEWRANADRTGIADPPVIPGKPCVPTSSNGAGYRLATSDGAVFDFGKLSYCGGLNTDVLPSNVVSMASTPDGGGYWLLLEDGSVYAFGDAKWFGDLRGSAWRGGPVPPGAPVVGLAATADGDGYFVVAADGSVYAFGDAKYRGSRGGLQTDGSVVGIAVDPLTDGYWIATAQGAVYAEGTVNWGSAAGLKLASPIVSIAAWPDGAGYWLAAQNGDVYSYGVRADGSKSHENVRSPVVGIAPSPSGNGYWLAAANGSVIHSGTSRPYGELAAKSHSGPVTAFGSVP